MLFFNDTLIRATPGWKAPETRGLTANLITDVPGGLVGGIIFSLFEYFIVANLFRRFGLLVSTITRGSLLMMLYVTMIVALSFTYNIFVGGKGTSGTQRGNLADPLVIINLVFYIIIAVLVVFARFKKPRIRNQSLRMQYIRATLRGRVSLPPAAD